MNWWMVAGLVLMPALAFMIGRSEGEAVGEDRGIRFMEDRILKAAMGFGHLHVDRYAIKVSRAELPPSDSGFWDCVDCTNPECSGRHL